MTPQELEARERERLAKLQKQEPLTGPTFPPPRPGVMSEKPPPDYAALQKEAFMRYSASVDSIVASMKKFTDAGLPPATAAQMAMQVWELHRPKL